MTNPLAPCDCNAPKTIVVLSSVCGVETLADRCSRCGSLSNKRTET